MQSLQTITAASVSEQAPNEYVMDAQALGLPAPRFLSTDLGTGARLWLSGIDEQGTATYKQRGPGSSLVLKVLGADPERAADAAKRAESSAALRAERAGAIAALRAKLQVYVEQSEQDRRAQADRILASDDAALSALRAPPLTVIYMGSFAKQVLVELDAAGEGEQEKALGYCLRKAERWVESWNPSPGSGLLTILHAAAEYEAAKRFAAELREALNPQSRPSQTAKPKKQTNK